MSYNLRHIVCLSFMDEKLLFTSAWVKSFRATVFKMRDIPAWVGITRILGGPIGAIATLQQKIDLNDFMFGTICQKVRASCR